MQAGTVNTITIWLLCSLKKNVNATGFTWVHLNSWKIKAFLKFWIWLHILWEFPLECDPDIWAERCRQWHLLDFKLESIYVSEWSKTTSSGASWMQESSTAEGTPYTAKALYMQVQINLHSAVIYAVIFKTTGPYVFFQEQRYNLGFGELIHFTHFLIAFLICPGVTGKLIQTWKLSFCRKENQFNVDDCCTNTHMPCYAQLVMLISII